MDRYNRRKMLRGVRYSSATGLAIAILAATSAAYVAEDPDEPWGAEGQHEEDAVVRIPEPLVFDLVRGLGARRGELETNVLFQAPFDDRDRSHVLWAPEIEYALADGFALEFELPFRGSELEGYKFAGQYTFGTAFEDHYIHGTQVIAEYVDDPDLWELTLLYLPGIRFDETWSALLMLGVRTETGDARGDDTEALANVNVFADVGPHLTLGLETNFASGLGDHSEWLVLPQVHWEVTDTFMLQAGAGAEFTDGGTYGTVALRAILEF